MGRSILEEAKRCFNCKKPRCKEGCPINTPINEFIKMFLDGKIMEAGEMLFENNPLSIVCSLVCPHENQCEGHCIRGNKDGSVHISMIENYISDYYLNYVDSKKTLSNNKKIAIIGSGPAGITIAITLAAKGYDVTIFEALDNIGGVLWYGIPEFRLPKSVLVNLKEKLINIGIKIRPNTLIGTYITVDDLFADGYKAVFIGTGVWKPRTLKIKGETLGHVHYAIDYLKNPKVYNLGKRVCIVGAGNVAMDVARTVLRNGSSDVSIMFREGPEDIEAAENEVIHAKMDGVKFQFYSAPLEITDDGIKYVKTKIKEGIAGQREIIYIENSEEIFKADSVILAIGQGPRANIISKTIGINVNGVGLIEVDDCGRTSRDGVFASGDVVTGAKTVVEAVKVSKKVAEAMDEYVKSI